mmetsp:Transcript_9045/g.12873  ORF Transcript_9045/g.12873 Transcript_9045/m.12873 type:complete len:502 (+) Transcript_9045:89-1594(+)
MSNADLLAMLGGSFHPGHGLARPENESKTILSFKAGKMTAIKQPNGRYLVTPDNRRGTLNVTWASFPGSARNSTAGELKLEWMDRRTRTTVDSHTIFASDNCTYSKVDTGREGDRIFLLQYGNNSDNRHFYWMQDKEEGNEDEENCVKINTYMTDPSEAASKANGDSDSEIDSNANTGNNNSNNSSANSNSNTRGSGLDLSGLGSGGLDNAALMQIVQNLGTPINNTDRPATEPTSDNSSRDTTSQSSNDNRGSGSDNNQQSNTNTNTNQPQAQMDALSNILQNMGMPQPNTSNTTSSAPLPTLAASTTTTTPAPTRNTQLPPTPGAPTQPSTNTQNGLTLADLQGAMAGLNTASPLPTTAAAVLQQPGPPLTTLITPEAINQSKILDNEAVKTKLINLLPEGQRTEEKLMENLRSPQVAQCLKSLTAALSGDDQGGLESFHSILANFHLDAKDGEHALLAGNPIQAFLDCVLKQVERDNNNNTPTNKKPENDDSDAKMNE